MHNLDELLIRGVFDRMARKKPSLAKYLIADEDEGEAVDVRVLGDQVIRHLPWPVGVELRRLFSGAMRELDRGRLDQIFKTIERTMQFLGFLLLSQLQEETLKAGLTIPKSFAGEFARRFDVLTMGNIAWLIRSIGNLFNQFKIEPFLPETAGILNNTFYQTLDFWAPERNEIGHYQFNLTQEEIEKRCVEYEERLGGILSALAFLCQYRLVTVREIHVIKPKREEPRFGHTVDLLNSADSDFVSKEEIHEFFTDSHCVLLMKDFKKPREFLNLSPLVIDTRAEVLDAREKFALKKDIFLYTKYHNGRLFYAGTEVTEKVDLSTLSAYPRLVTELEEIRRVLGGAP